MGIKNLIKKAGGKAADSVAKLSVLSPEQLKDMESRREAYLSEAPHMDDEIGELITRRLMAASSIEIYHEYLQHIDEIYVPIKKDTEYDTAFNPGYNIRYFNITKWVTDKKENSLEKLVNVYEVLSNEECNIALVFHRTMEKTEVYMAVTNTQNAKDNIDIENYRHRLLNAIRGNFPGTELKDIKGKGIIPFMKEDQPYSIASASNIPGEKSEKFISQTIEKLLDGIVPEDDEQEYTLILLATPVRDVDEQKFHLSNLYSAMAPYASWQTSYQFQQSDSTNSTATFGVNAGVSAGVQAGQNQSLANTTGDTETTGNTMTDSTSDTTTDTTGTSDTDTIGSTASDTNGGSYSSSTGTTTTEGYSHTDGMNVGASHTDGISGNVGVGIKSLGINAGVSTNASDTVSLGKSATDAISNSVANSATETLTSTMSQTVAKSVTKAATSTVSKAVAKTVGSSVANSFSKALSRSSTLTSGTSRGMNIGGNFGANFARSSNVSATVGKNEGITQSFTNYTIKHTLEVLEGQMKRMDQSSALGMWDFAAYIVSEDQNVASNVAHSYLALTQGEQSFMSQTAVNLWRGDLGENSNAAKEIYAYLKELRHPIFGLSPAIVSVDVDTSVYPGIVTAATSLSGKELAYSLNFPQKSVAGFPVLECAEFGRNIVQYGEQDPCDTIHLGHIFHMNHEEKTPVELSKASLASHVFVTGSTGSGKSNAVYQLLNEAIEQDVKFLVIEPAKGEYKNVFGNDEDIRVYGTNPELSPLLRINPFSFEPGIHIYEHMDRLVEIFNVCWPMYAAMPAVLKNAIEKAYEDCGWDLVQSTNVFGDDLYPSFADVARNIRGIIDSSEYDSENKGAYKGSLLTRLQSLSNGINGMVFSSDELPSEVLFDSNVIVDLSRVGSTETKSLIMGMLVLKLQEYRLSKASGGNDPLKHITVLEEAHNILKRTSSEQAAEGSNLVGKSVEMIANAIAEMRTFGEGFVIVDQAPGLLDMSAIRNTNTKIILRLPDQGDRELVGKAANLNDDQINELAKLPCGVGAVYQNEWIQPILCKVDKYHHGEQIYMYDNESRSEDCDNEDKRIYIATLLSKGTPVGREIVMSDIRLCLKEMKIPVSAQVDLMKTLTNPPRKAQMIKMGYFMNLLFPEVADAVRTSYNSGCSPEEWTMYAKLSLDTCIDNEVDKQVQRDIIQGVITHYLYTELNNEAALVEWRQKGNLR